MKHLTPLITMRRKYMIPVAVMLAVLLQQCISLAPAFDENITNGLLESSKEVMVLFSKVSGGTKPDTSSERTEMYDEAIGAFEALKLQVTTRPMPSNKVMSKISAEFVKRGLPAITQPPTIGAIDNIIKNLEQMKSSDKANGLSTVEVTVFKKTVSVYLDQALTYERFLER